MKVQEVEEKISTKITGLEHQETRLHEWLDCIRQVGEIAEKMGYAKRKDQVEEGGLMQAFEEIVEQADLEETSSAEPLAEEAHLAAVESAEHCEAEEEGAESLHSDEPEEAGNYLLQEKGTELLQPRKPEEVSVDPAPEREEEEQRHLDVPDEGNLDQLRAALSKSQTGKTGGKKSIGSFISAFLSADEE